MSTVRKSPQEPGPLQDPAAARKKLAQVAQRTDQEMARLRAGAAAAERLRRQAEQELARLQAEAQAARLLAEQVAHQAGTHRPPAEKTSPNHQELPDWRRHPAAVLPPEELARRIPRQRASDGAPGPEDEHFEVVRTADVLASVPETRPAATPSSVPEPHPPRRTRSVRRKSKRRRGQDLALRLIAAALMTAAAMLLYQALTAGGW